MPDDPLEAIEALDPKAQIAVIVSVLRTTRNTMARVERKVDWVLRALWTLVTTIIIGIIVFLISQGVRHDPASPALGSTPPTHASVVSSRK